MWSGIVRWVTPWTLALHISYDDPDSVHTVYIPMALIEDVRDFVPTASRNDVRSSYRDDGEGVAAQ